MFQSPIDRNIFIGSDRLLVESYLYPATPRLAVTKRKISGDSRSMRRFQETANLLSVIQTCRFQGRSVVDFFSNALMATIAIIDRPSLIPHFNT